MWIQVPDEIFGNRQFPGVNNRLHLSKQRLFQRFRSLDARQQVMFLLITSNQAMIIILIPVRSALGFRATSRETTGWAHAILQLRTAALTLVQFLNLKCRILTNLLSNRLFQLFV